MRTTINTTNITYTNTTRQQQSEAKRVRSGTTLATAQAYKDEFLRRMFGAIGRGGQVSRNTVPVTMAHTGPGATRSGTTGTTSGAQVAHLEAATNTHTGIDDVPMGNNIVGVGYGVKMASGAITQDTAVRVYVRSKLPASELSPSELVPDRINGLPTDVIPVGDLRVLIMAGGLLSPGSANHRPVTCGVSIGAPGTTAGTLGCLVRRAGTTDDGERFILSNYHVLIGQGNAAVGSPVLEPGPLDGGNPNNPIASVAAWSPIEFNQENSMDAALALLDSVGDVHPDIPIIGRVAQPDEPMSASPFQSVRKYGRTTRHTVGVVMDISADIKVRYGQRMVAFSDQLAIIGAGGPFSDGGDSGSLVVDGVTRRPVALLFAEGNGTTFANPIQVVVDRFGVQIL